MELKVYKKDPKAILPVFATEGSACFDLHACITPETTVKYRHDFDSGEYEKNLDHIFLIPNRRYLISTGLIFDIPKGYSIRVYSRSGLAYKSGIIVANGQGIIDSDYRDPVGLILLNVSQVDFKINHGDRLCQAELVKQEEYKITETLEEPLPVLSRAGGFGSTGV